MSNYVVRTDDAIHRERGQLIALGDSTLWGILPALRPHYVLLSVFAATASLCGGLVYLTGANGTSTVAYGLAGGLLAQFYVGRHLGKGVTFRGLVQTMRSETYWWWVARLESVREREARTPGLLLAKSLRRKVNR